MKDWGTMLGDVAAPYKFALGMEKGVRFPGKPPYPQVDVAEADELYVRRMVLQRMIVVATAPEDGEESLAYEVVRLVAELEGGSPMEIHRTATPVDLTTAVQGDPTHCAACGKKIPYGEGAEYEGAYYHKGRCLIVEDEPLRGPAERGHVPRKRLEEIE